MTAAIVRGDLSRPAGGGRAHTGDDDRPHAGVGGTGEDSVGVLVKSLVGEVGADVDEAGAHGRTSPGSVVAVVTSAA
jgi:hypothetical protein